MICDKCNKQFKADTPISVSKKMIGLCQRCGRKLRYEEIPEGFLGGALFAVCGTPFIFVYLFNWVYIPVAAVGVGAASFFAWFFAKKIGGYIYIASVEEFKKSNRLLSFFAGMLGFMYTVIWSISIMQFLK